MTTWEEVYKKPEYQALQPREKELAKRQYFDEVISPQVPVGDVDTAKQEFLSWSRDLEKAVPEHEGFFGPTLKAIPRVGGAVAGGMLAYTASGLAGYAKLLTSGPEEALKTMRGIQELPSKLLNNPEEQQSLGIIGKPFEVVAESAKWWGDYTYKKTGNAELSALVSTSVEAAAILGLPKLSSSLMGSLKAGKIAKAREIALEIQREKLSRMQAESKRLEKLAAAEREIARESGLKGEPLIERPLGTLKAERPALLQTPLVPPIKTPPSKSSPGLP